MSLWMCHVCQVVQPFREGTCAGCGGLLEVITMQADVAILAAHVKMLWVAVSVIVIIGLGVIGVLVTLT